MFTSVNFMNFKGLRRYTVSLRDVNVLVGPNNAGKSSILDSFRILSACMRYARNRNPSNFQVEGRMVYGYDVPPNSLPITLANIHSNYQDGLDTHIDFRLRNGSRLIISFYDSSRCVMQMETSKASPRNTSQFRKEFPADIAIFPTLGPLEENEDLLTDDYVERWQLSRLSHRMFRNIWRRRGDDFNEFKSLVEITWPGITVRPPEVHGYGHPKLTMFCEEDRILRELAWAGFGFQVWLQLLTHLISAKSATTLIIDEPEIYLHPDLQHKLFDLLRQSGKQIILATHSVEIINEAEHDEVVLIDKSRASARRIGDISGLQEAISSIGSAQNVHLAKLSKDKRVLFFEGADFKIVRRMAERCGYKSLAENINLTIVPIGGFAQRQRIEDTNWIFSKVLGAEIAIAALLDRDYRCEEEITKILEGMRNTTPYFHILGSKEIENYLLVPTALSKATHERLKDRGADKRLYEMTTAEAISSMLMNIADSSKADISSQIIAHRIRYLNRGTVDISTITRETVQRFEKNWQEFDGRIRLVPGKAVLSSLNEKLQTLGVTLTIPGIIRNMTRDEVPNDLHRILDAFNKFAG